MYLYELENIPPKDLREATEARAFDSPSTSFQMPNLTDRGRCEIILR